jgi:tRNA(fMet)-specific endonuclease VapC
MSRFMLDTDTCSYITHPQVLKRLQSLSVGDVCMSVVTKAELLYGVEVSPDTLRMPRRLRRFSRTWKRSTSPTMRQFTTRRFGRT